MKPDTCAKCHLLNGLTPSYLPPSCVGRLKDQGSKEGHRDGLGNVEEAMALEKSEPCLAISPDLAYRERK
jgi:hypothetical protein